MKEELKHIFDASSCLTKRQLRDYVQGTMSREEIYAAEHHINSCFLCSEAVEGMQLGEEDALAAAEQLDTGFLHDHFNIIHPEIHLNSIAPTATATHVKQHKKRIRLQPIFHPGSIAAGIVLLLGILWYLQFGKHVQPQQPLAQQTTHASGSEQPVAATLSAREPQIAEEQTQPKKSVASEPTVVKTETRTDQQPMAFAPVKSAGAPVADSMNAKQTDHAQASVEVVVKDYKVPLVKKEEPAAATALTTDQTEALPAGSAQDVAANTRSTSQEKQAKNISISGARASSTQYTIERVSAKETKARKEKTQPALSNLEEGKKSLKAGNYSAALISFHEAMSNGSKTHKQEATMLAAQCYIKLGQNDRAEKLLQELAAENGPQKKQAKKMLKELKKDQSE